MASFIIRDVRLFDGESIIENASVLVQNGLISEVGPNITAAEGIPVFSKPGHTLLPGLIDAHSHPYADVKGPEQVFRFGITTLMDLQNPHENAVLQKKRAAERRDFPDIKSCHLAATIEGGWPAWIEDQLGVAPPGGRGSWPNVKDVKDADPYVERAIADGADFIKLMKEGGKAIGVPDGVINQTPDSVHAAVVQSAHRRGLKVIAHALSLKDTLDILKANVDGLAHTFFDEPITQEVIDEYKRTGAWLNPTLVVIGSLTGESAALLERFAKDERVLSKVSTDDVPLFHKCMHMKSENAKFEYAIDSVRQLQAAGIDIICGSDSAVGGPGVVFGSSLHIELHLLVKEVGLTPLEALKSATSVTARCFGWNDRGRVAPGLKADLLLVEGDPSNDISDLLNIRGIWRDGVKFEGHAGFPVA